MVYHPPRKPVADSRIMEHLMRDNLHKAEAYRVYIEVFDEHTDWKKLHGYLRDTCGYRWVHSYTYFTTWMNAVMVQVAEIRAVSSK